MKNYHQILSLLAFCIGFFLTGVASPPGLNRSTPDSLAKAPVWVQRSIAQWELDVEVAEAGEIQVELYNQLGQLVLRRTEWVESGSTSLTLSLQRYDAGIFLALVKKEGESFPYSLNRVQP